MAIERRERLHDLSLMLHSGRGGQFHLESYEWDTDADGGKGAIVPGSGRLSLPQAIAFESGDSGTAWTIVREMLDMALVAATNQAIAERDAVKLQRDAALRVAEEKVSEAATHLQARDAMRAALAGKAVEIQAALAQEEADRALVAEVVHAGT